MATYVISDIHGCYQMFQKMLKKIKFDEKKDTLYILGDILDRGPQIAEMIKWVWEHESNHVIMIKGNHEEMFVEYPDPDYYSFYFEEFSKKDLLYLINWIEGLPLYKEVTVNGIDYVLVHAGITEEILANKDTGKDASEVCLWSRTEFYTGDGIDGKIIVFGHTPLLSRVLDGKMNPVIWRSKNKRMIGIDTGAVFSKQFGGCLSCLRLDDQKEFYVSR